MLNRTPTPPKSNLTMVTTLLWSVMIPVYNCFNYIEITLNSVLQQAPSSELMQIEVIDDCSIDGDVEN
jgi:glycosyltransferase involved in cell wall biosynthesis